MLLEYLFREKAFGDFMRFLSSFFPASSPMTEAACRAKPETDKRRHFRNSGDILNSAKSVPRQALSEEVFKGGRGLTSTCESSRQQTSGSARNGAGTDTLTESRGGFLRGDLFHRQAFL
jgi:hypothetical protein